MRRFRGLKIDRRTMLYSFYGSAVLHIVAFMVVGSISLINSVKTQVDKFERRYENTGSIYQQVEQPITISLVPHKRPPNKMGIVLLEDGTYRVEGIPADFPSMFEGYKPMPADSPFPKVNAMIRQMNMDEMETFARMDRRSYHLYLSLQKEIEEFGRKNEEILDGFDAQLDEMQKTFEDIKEGTLKLQECMYRCLMKPVFMGKADINDLFSRAYLPEERNEEGFNDFFTAYLDAYLFAHGASDDITQALTANKEITDTMRINVEFDENGNFRYTSIEMNPEFQDIGGKVSDHYTTLLQKVPHKFVSPTRCRLETPYGSSFTITNPGMYYGPRMKNPLDLERIVEHVE